MASSHGEKTLPSLRETLADVYSSLDALRHRQSLTLPPPPPPWDGGAQMSLPTPTHPLPSGSGSSVIPSYPVVPRLEVPSTASRLPLPSNGVQRRSIRRSPSSEVALSPLFTGRRSVSPSPQTSMPELPSRPPSSRPAPYSYCDDRGPGSSAGRHLPHLSYSPYGSSYVPYPARYAPHLDVAHPALSPSHTAPPPPCPPSAPFQYAASADRHESALIGAPLRELYIPSESDALISESPFSLRPVTSWHPPAPTTPSYSSSSVEIPSEAAGPSSSHSTLARARNPRAPRPSPYSTTVSIKKKGKKAKGPHRTSRDDMPPPLWFSENDFHEVARRLWKPDRRYKHRAGESTEEIMISCGWEGCGKAVSTAPRAIPKHLWEEHRVQCHNGKKASASQSDDAVICRWHKRKSRTDSSLHVCGDRVSPHNLRTHILRDVSILGGCCRHCGHHFTDDSGMQRHLKSCLRTGGEGVPDATTVVEALKAHGVEVLRLGRDGEYSAVVIHDYDSDDDEPVV